jgi:hypothetical protein
MPAHTKYKNNYNTVHPHELFMPQKINRIHKFVHKFPMMSHICKAIMNVCETKPIRNMHTITGTHYDIYNLQCMYHGLLL